MSKAELTCPSCGVPVSLGDIECANCGINLKSGESYASKVKQAKGKDVHPEHFTGGLYIAVAVASALFLFAGFMWHKTVDETFAQQPDLLRAAVNSLQEIEDTIQAAEHDRRAGDSAAYQAKIQQARTDLEAMITWFGGEIDSLKPDDRRGPNQYRGRRAEIEWNKKAGKQILANLQAKAKKRLKEISV